MTVFDVEPMTIHGGTLRYYIARKTSVWAQTSVSTKHEDVFYSVLSLNSFERKVKAHRTALKHMLVNLKAKGYRIAAVSAPAKGMTLLNYCGLGRDLIDFVTEKAPLKIGKYTPGTHIPVVPDSELLTKSPDYALLLAWNFADEIMKNLSEYSKQGGKFIVPIPFPTVCEPEQVLERVN
jgi:hypothetical protein